MLLSPADFRKHQATALPDTALQTLLDAAEFAIARRLGAADALVERFGPAGPALPGDTRPGAFLYPSRAVAAVTTITETIGTTVTTLAANDYRVWPGGWMIERLATGTNPRSAWTGTVDLSHTSPLDVADRKRVQLGLVKLDLVHNPGLTAEEIGDWKETYADNSAMNYSLEREALLATLGAGLVIA